MPDNTTKDKPPHYGYHPPYAAVCLFRRQAGRTDKGNCLESGEVRGNMLIRRFAFVPLYIGRMAKNFRADFEFSALHLCLSFHFVCLSFPPSQNS